jgi:hypothetical protein
MVEEVNEAFGNGISSVMSESENKSAADREMKKAKGADLPTAQRCRSYLYCIPYYAPEYWNRPGSSRIASLKSCNAPSMSPSTRRAMPRV